MDKETFNIPLHRFQDKAWDSWGRPPFWKKEMKDYFTYSEWMVFAGENEATQIHEHHFRNEEHAKEFLRIRLDTILDNAMHNGAMFGGRKDSKYGFFFDICTDGANGMPVRIVADIDFDTHGWNTDNISIFEPEDVDTLIEMDRLPRSFHLDKYKKYQRTTSIAPYEGGVPELNNRIDDAKSYFVVSLQTTLLPEVEKHFPLMNTREKLIIEDIQNATFAADYLYNWRISNRSQRGKIQTVLKAGSYYSEFFESVETNKDGYGLYLPYPTHVIRVAPCYISPEKQCDVVSFYDMLRLGLKKQLENNEISLDKYNKKLMSFNEEEKKHFEK